MHQIYFYLYLLSSHCRSLNDVGGIIGNGPKCGLVSKSPQLECDILEDEEEIQGTDDETNAEYVEQDVDVWRRKPTIASFPDGPRSLSADKESSEPGTPFRESEDGSVVVVDLGEKASDDVVDIKETEDIKKYVISEGHKGPLEDQKDENVKGQTDDIAEDQKDDTEENQKDDSVDDKKDDTAEVQKDDTVEVHNDNTAEDHKKDIAEDHKKDNVEDQKEVIMENEKDDTVMNRKEDTTEDEKDDTEVVEESEKYTDKEVTDRDSESDPKNQSTDQIAGKSRCKTRDSFEGCLEQIKQHI